MFEQIHVEFTEEQVKDAMVELARMLMLAGYPVDAEFVVEE